MARSDGAGMPQGPDLLLLRKSGDALEEASPPFDASAASDRLREAARARGLLRPGGMPEDNLAVTDAELEEEAPPFDVEAGASRLRKAARACGLLSSGISEGSAWRLEGDPAQLPPMRADDSLTTETRGTSPRNQETPLTMYITAWCGFCRNLKSQLARAGVEVTEVDIERDSDAAEFVMTVNRGHQTVPTLLFADGSTMVNPSAAQVLARLAELAAASQALVQEHATPGRGNCR